MLIGFGSKARQGKDTAADAIVNYFEHKRQLSKKHNLFLPPEAKNFKFAQALYDECREKYQMAGKDSVLLQRVGTEYRQKNPNHWINKAFEEISKFQGIALISDVRYKNEADYIRSYGGYLVSVIRLNPNGQQFISDDRPSDHPSEVDLDGYNWDYKIVVPTGQAALVGEFAITLVEYLINLRRK